MGRMLLTVFSTTIIVGALYAAIHLLNGELNWGTVIGITASHQWLVSDYKS